MQHVSPGSDPNPTPHPTPQTSHATKVVHVPIRGTHLFPFMLARPWPAPGTHWSASSLTSEIDIWVRAGLC